MRKLLLLLSAMLIMSIPLMGQEDLENIVSDDIEIEGLENIWIGCSLERDNSMPGIRDARPSGGSVQFLTYVQKCMGRVMTVLFNKYPEEMLGMLGTHADIYIDFAVLENGEVELEGITNGAIFAIDPMIANKIFKSYKRWRPAKRDGESIKRSLRLKIDISI